MKHVALRINPSFQNKARCRHKRHNEECPAAAGKRRGNPEFQTISLEDSKSLRRLKKAPRDDSPFHNLGASFSLLIHAAFCRVMHNHLHVNALLDNKIYLSRKRHSGESRNPAAPRLRRERLSIALTIAGREFALFRSLPLASWIPAFAGMTLAVTLIIYYQIVNL
ncbi:MAG: hypothetical protein ABTQ34_02160 [Bdellovibrionales bacterium]